MTEVGFGLDWAEERLGIFHKLQICTAENNRVSIIHVIEITTELNGAQYIPSQGFPTLTFFKQMKTDAENELALRPAALGNLGLGKPGKWVKIKERGVTDRDGRREGE